MSAGVAPWRQRSDDVDDLVRGLAEPVIDGPVVVLAVGGYGRRALCPASDVDLVLVHDGLGDAALEALVRAVIYPLWDHRLTVGYAVRDRWDALASMHDLDTATAMLDMRVLAGDVGLAQRLRTDVVRRVRRRPHVFLDRLRAADAARHAKAGDAAEALEPDLKNGAGGLRDVHSLRWAAGALVGTIGLDPLVAAGYLGAPDRTRVAQAESELLRVRTALHDVTLTAHPTDVLRLDVQDAVASQLGYTDTPTALAPHQLLTDVYLATRTIDHVHRRAWTLIRADVDRGARRRTRPADTRVDGFELADGVLRLGDVAIDTPDVPARLFAALVSTGAMLDRATAGALRRHAAGATTGWTWSNSARAKFLATLWRGDVARAAMAELDDAGVWTAMLPQWAPLRGRAQRNPYHRYALDRHHWYAATRLGELVRREAWASDALAAVVNRDALMLGVLFHDVGKAFGEPHEHTGVPVACAMARHLGADDDTVSRVGWLVRHHLVLGHAARRRDIADPALASELATLVGDREGLAALHLLAVADAQATGPTSFDDWIGSLLRSLVRRVGAVLDAQNPDELVDGAITTARAAQALAADLGTSADDVRAHLGLLPTRYAAAVTPRAVVRHTLMTTAPLEPADIRTRVTPSDSDPDGAGSFDELDVVAWDSPGLFAKVVGVIALHHGSVVAADAFTRDDGLAVDTFRVSAPDGAGGSWWARVEGDLADAVAGRLAVRARVGRVARADQDRVDRLPEVATDIDARPDAGGRATVIEVRTRDRAGVLYAIATAFAELEVDLVIARIETVGHEAIDVFTCRNSRGEPLDDVHAGEVKLAVRAALADLEAQ